MLLDFLRLFSFFRNIETTYKGFVNIPELVYTLIRAIGAGGSVAVIFQAIIVAIPTFITDATLATTLTTVFSAIAALVAGIITLVQRLKAGPVLPPAPTPTPTPPPTPKPPMV